MLKSLGLITIQYLNCGRIIGKYSMISHQLPASGIEKSVTRKMNGKLTSEDQVW